WKNADNNSDPDEAIYLDNGHEPKPWDVKPRTTAAPKRLVPIRQLQLLREQSRGSGFIVQFDPAAPLAQEVRVNRPAFNFILTNQL
ncbi:hypothetical protein NL529_30875, partial [Klebsiella pneumoniae]|nr:hypothetical protein [Klebsiella pneumoniae]